MKLSDVIAHYGSKSAACEALGITKQAGTKWGYWMLRETATTLEALTEGAIKFDYSASPIELNGTKYEPATDIESALRIRRNMKELYFLVDGEMISAKEQGEAESLKLFRKYPPYRKG